MRKCAVTNLCELCNHCSVPLLAAAVALAEKGVHFVNEYHTGSETPSKSLCSGSDVALTPENAADSQKLPKSVFQSRPRSWESFVSVI